MSSAFALVLVLSLISGSIRCGNMIDPLSSSRGEKENGVAKTTPKTPPAFFVPRRIREAAGPSVKSALSHTFTCDTRDDPFASTRGSFLKLKQVSSLYLSFGPPVGVAWHSQSTLMKGCWNLARNTRDWVVMRILSRRSRKAPSRAGLEVAMYVLCFEQAI